jgi:hypothetical protein
MPQLLYKIFDTIHSEIRVKVKTIFLCSMMHKSDWILNGGIVPGINNYRGQ